MADPILVLNAGSSSIKFAVFGGDGGGLHAVERGELSGIGGAARFVAARGGDRIVDERLAAADGQTHDAALRYLMDWLGATGSGPRLRAVAHRIVHGGVTYRHALLIDAGVLEALRALVPLAPLHQPQGLAGVQAAMAAMPAVPQVACFDTAFHRSQSLVAQTYGLPPEYFDAGVRRYGFHGLSCEYIVARLAELDEANARGRVVIAHLGNGASMTAVSDGRSVASTMGFTALDGLPMGTRSGGIDPGVILYLQREGMDLAAIEQLLYRGSGLLGMSGISNDVRTLLASDDEHARLALDYFVYRVGRELGSLAAALGGLDALVFTGGIGENSAEVRGRIAASAGWLGVSLDAAANARGSGRIDGGRGPAVWVIHTDEESVMAQQAEAVLAAR